MIIYSPNNFELLNKLRKDLIEVGYIDDQDRQASEYLGWNDALISDMSRYPIRYMVCYPDKHVTFFNYPVDIVSHQTCTLTESNYTDILNQLKDAL